MADDPKRATEKRGRIAPTTGIPPTFELSVTGGPDKGKKLGLDAAAPQRILLGHSAACTLRLSDRTVSRRHASVDLAGDRLRLHDLDSTNGTLVNGVAIREVFLAGGEVVRLGDTTLAITKKLPRYIELPAGTNFGRVLGESAAMRKLFPVFKRLASVVDPVLIEGEGGVGKELLAEELLAQSSKKDGRFSVLSCNGVPQLELDRDLETLLADADLSALFVDELADLSAKAQGTLLSAIDRRDLRVITATRRDPDREVEEGRLREDLFFRLVGARVELPPLRERAEDVVLLARHFWRELSATDDLPDDFAVRWEGHRWPGNVRELRATVLAAFANATSASSADTVVAGDSPEGGEARDLIEDVLGRGLPFSRAKQMVNHEFKRRYVAHALDLHGSVAKAARASGLAHRYFQMIKSQRR
jgi:DNA-binding NtrC family response regulator